MPTLAGCVGDVAVFGARYWGARPLFVDAGRTDANLTSLLTVDDVDRIVSSGARWPGLRMVAGGATAEPRRYCTPTRIGSQDIERVADVRKVLDEYRRGATLVLQSLHRTWPSVSRFAADLEAEISHTVQANAYLSPPRSTGLAPHADGHDVLVLQLHGRKHWTVAGLGELDVTPGDVLYIPRGTQHEARTADIASLHLTIGIHRRTYRDVVRRALSTLDEQMDRPLPLGYASSAEDEVADEVARALGAAIEGLEQVDIEGLTTELMRRTVRRHEAGLLAAAVGRETLTGASVVEPAAPWSAVSEVADGRLRLSWSGVSLELPSVAGPALETLRRSADAGGVHVDDLPGLDAESRLVLVRRLLDEGAVRCVRQPPAAMVGAAG